MLSILDDVSVPDSGYGFLVVEVNVSVSLGLGVHLRLGRPHLLG